MTGTPASLVAVSTSDQQPGRWRQLSSGIVTGVALVVLVALGVLLASVFHPAWDRCAVHVDGQIVERPCSE